MRLMKDDTVMSTQTDSPTDSTMVIRPAKDGDVARVRELQIQWANEDITYGYIAADEEYIRKAFQAYFFIAEIEDHIVGFITSSKHTSGGLSVIPKGTEYLEIDDLYVVPEHRSCGIGTALIQGVLSRAKSNGLEYSHVFTATKDVHRILRFYEQHGFRSWGVQMFQRLCDAAKT
jgi:GNAT superfamily N-acetyltransferase